MRTFLTCMVGVFLLGASTRAQDAPGSVETIRPQGDFVRYMLTLDKGFVAAGGTTEEPLIMHLPCRAGRFAPQGWCVEPGANIIGIVDATTLELTGRKINGKVHMVPWEAGVSREYDLDGTAGKSGITGTFTLRQIIPGRTDSLVVRGTFTGKMSSQEELAHGNELTPGKQYPMWRGSAGSGNTDSGRKIALSAANARLAWLSEELIPNAAWNIGTKGLSGGCDNVSVEDGRVYLVYYVPSGDVEAKGVDLGKPLPEYTPERWRVHWLVEADDVVHCFDARTGATLWKTAFKRAGLNTNARVPGLKGTPHRTVCVADGKAFAVGSAGHLFCLNAETGAEIWRSALPRARKIGDEVRERSIAARQVCGMSILNGHPVYAEGMLVCADTGGSHNGKRAVAFVEGFDAATGDLIWTYGLKQGFYMGASVNRWVHNGRAWIIAAGPVGTVCLDPKTGKPLWRLKEALDNGGTTVALGEDYLVSSGRSRDDLRRVEWEGGSFSAPYKATPMRCYRMTPSGATLVWERPALDYVGKCVPLIRDGHMYAKVGGKVSTAGIVAAASSSRHCSIVCIELATGKIAATATEVSTCEWESYVGGDGFVTHGWGLGQWGYAVFRADPKDLRMLTPLQLPRKPHYYGWCTTPAYADGRLFIRTWDRMACYDLRLDERIAKAAAASGRGDAVAAVRLFKAAIRDPEASVRREALAGLGGMGDKAAEAFDALVGI
ncbi:PQQ-binding-like beta-propeller repeat protein, partial [Verrucomicrobiota bacterium]